MAAPSRGSAGGAAASGNASLDFEDLDQDSPCTLMLRGIPCKFNQHDVSQVLDDMGFHGTLVFIYVPFVESRNSNMGYGFVCFRSATIARRCFDVCDGRVFGGHLVRSQKLCRVVVADSQGGLEAVLSRQRRAQNGRRPKVLAWDATEPCGPEAASVELEQTCLPRAVASSSQDRLYSPAQLSPQPTQWQQPAAQGAASSMVTVSGGQAVLPNEDSSMSLFQQLSSTDRQSQTEQSTSTAAGDDIREWNGAADGSLSSGFSVSSMSSAPPSDLLDFARVSDLFSDVELPVW